jgi:3-hydroxyisobutyrate dehydrogenase-like beta-hydroxyacid dehydrogenase
LDKRIGFIGLGRMGAGMARNLINAGLDVTVYDVAQPAVASLVKAGASSATSPAEVARAVDVVLLCVPDAPQVESLLAGENGLLAGVHDGLAVVDHTTMDRMAALRIGATCAAAGIGYCDCPISGMPFRAEDGTLTIMFGGEDDLFERIKPLLEVTGEFIVPCGALGSGQLMKAINNVIYDVNIAALCEVMPLALKAGLEPQTLARVLTTASSRSFASEYFVPRIMEAKFEGDFSLSAAYKDIHNVQQVAVELRAPTPVVNAMIAVYQQAINAGLGDEPKSAMVKLYEAALGVEMRGEPPAK